MPSTNKHSSVELSEAQFDAVAGEARSYIVVFYPIVPAPVAENNPDAGYAVPSGDPGNDAFVAYVQLQGLGNSGKSETSGN
jgi:hypothetical protein